MPVGYTALKTVASMDDVASSAGKAKPPRSRRGHAAGNHGKCACCKPLGKLCGKFCGLTTLTKILIMAVVALFVVTGLLWIGGASLTGPASTNLRSESLCYRGGGGRKGGKGGDGSGGREGEGDGELGKDEDPTVPLLRQNVYAWYLANTGIIVTLTIFSSCVCCVSYVGLCCELPSWAKILGAIGIAIVAITFSIFLSWLAGGVYLVANFDKVALLTDVCRNVMIYVVLLVVYLVTVCVVGVVWCVWRARDLQRRGRTTTRQRLDTTPKLLRV